MSIYKKLLEVKSEIGTLVKKSDNPFFKSKYLDLSDLLNAVDPLLGKHGLVLLQPIKDGHVFSIIFDVDTAESVESSITLPQLNDPQKLGSAITYFRRYTLQSLLSLQAEDDDGNKASKPEPKAKKPISDERFSKALEAISEGKSTKEDLTENFELTVMQSNMLNEI